MLEVKGGTKMTVNKPLYISFLWHMHQPWYIWDEQGESAMPWVRLHSLKDYYDMPRIVEETGFPATFNYVPSLLKQIELLAEGNTTDPYWEAIIPEMDEMDEVRLNMVVSRLFEVNYERFIKTSPRYMDLNIRRGKSNDWRMFESKDIRDIQVHFLLAWMGESFREMPEVKKLIIKDENYSIQEKRFLIELAQQRLKQIIPYLKKLWDENKIELTFSPYFHPIIPLLCDVSLARKALPSTTLPNKQFIYPADAMRQIQMGKDYFNKTFGRNPQGIWPPEGSVADEIVPMFIEADTKYFFTDEDILKKSLELSYGQYRDLTPQKLYTPYSIFRGKQRLSVFFRDKKLSDKIGFEYYKWDVEEAVNDFINSLMRIRDALPHDDKDYIISIILDGENAWEYYEHNGKPFLTMLYTKLLEHPDIVPITFQEYLSNHTDFPPLDRLAPGSWINGDFTTWCGSPEKNRAWELLSEARSYFQMNSDAIEPELKQKIIHYISVAEGSDWFWWFGDTNYTPYIEYFDTLFRHQIRRIYELMDETPPRELEEPVHIIEHPAEPIRNPIQFMKPSLEGKATTYFEWSSAGFYRASGFRGTMHTAKPFIIQRLFFGFDIDNLYFRIDSKNPLIEFMKKGGNFSIEFMKPVRMELKIFYNSDTEKIQWDLLEINDEEKVIEDADIEVVCEQICEMRSPFAVLSAQQNDIIRLVLYVKENSFLEQRFPGGGQYIEITVPSPDFEDSMWYV
ncbi:glycoside hydrolase [bacterium]|nr:MAG: glycoside hydrolase [bacterium]